MIWKWDAFKSKWYTDVGVPIVKVSNFTVDSVDISNLVCIPDEIAQNYTKHELRPKDVVIQTVGSWPSQPESVVGKVIKIPLQFSGSLLNQNAVKIIPRSHLDKGYLFYMLRDNDFKGYIVATAQGAASQASITLASIRNYTFHLPLFPIQRKIAAALSAYDDLIENNTRRIKILEEMASTIYREWFVEFRFPGHEGVEMVESELGLIPQGWEVSLIDELIDFKSGYAFKSKAFVDQGRYNVVTIKNVKDGEFHPVCDNRIIDLPSNLPDHCHLKNGDILISLTGNIGRVCLVYGKDYLLNQRVAKLVPKNPDLYPFVYVMFRQRDLQLRLEAIATGVAQQNLSPIKAGRLTCLIPSPRLLTQFSNLVKPYIDQILNLNQKNTNLRQTRDLLLPKLISGEIDVSELDINIG